MITCACLLKLVETTGICLSLDICSPHFANLATSLYMPLFSKVWQGAKRIFHDHLMFLSFWSFEESSMQSSHQRGFELLLRYKIRPQLSMAIHGPHQCRVSEVLTDKVHQLGLFWKWLAPDMTKMTKCQQSTAQVCVGLCVCVFFCFCVNILLLENSHPGFQCPNLDHGTDSFIWVLEVIAQCDPCGPYDMHNRRIKLPHGPWVLASTCD